MTIKKLVGALVGSMLVLSSANAALISMDVAYGAIQATAAEVAFLGQANPGYVTEKFDSWDTTGQTLVSGNQQASWIATAPFFNTAAGIFTVTQDALSDSGEVNPGNLMIESVDTGEFGRGMLKASGDFWLDSNDVQTMSWNLKTVNASFNSLGFYMVDANDNRAQLILRYNDGTAETIIIGTGLANGNVAYITLASDASISMATIVFDNNGNSERKTNDGFSIDNITVATVPEPTALALLCIRSYKSALSI